MERGLDHCTRVQTWNPPLVLNGSPIPLDSSIKDFQKGKARYVANALKQPLLLPDDMAKLRTMKKHEMFQLFHLIPFLFLFHFLIFKEGIQAAYIVEELVNNSHR